MQDKTCGGLLLLGSIAAFAYFVIWVFFTPFMHIDIGSVNVWFPPRSWATTGLISAIVAGAVIYGVTVGTLLIRDHIPRIERCR